MMDNTPTKMVINHEMIDAVNAMAETKPDAEIEVFGWSDLYGRGVSAKQVWQYEEDMAEIRREKERRMRKYMMKHRVRNDGKPVRKEKRKSYEKEMCNRFDPWAFCGCVTIKKYRELSAEKYDALDYEIEKENVAEFLMWEGINAEIEAMRKFDKETEELQKLEVWLQWA